MKPVVVWQTLKRAVDKKRKGQLLRLFGLKLLPIAAPGYIEEAVR